MLYMLHEGEEEKGNSYLTMIYGALLTRYAERNEESKKTIQKHNSMIFSMTFYVRQCNFHDYLMHCLLDLPF